MTNQIQPRQVSNTIVYQPRVIFEALNENSISARQLDNVNTDCLDSTLVEKISRGIE